MRFPDVDWWCDRCNAYLNGQAGFDDHKYTWKCEDCGHKNSISRDNIECSVKHVYFVAETKGSLSTLQLKGAENAKIECARKFFEQVNQRNSDDVKYDVVTDYDELLQLVTAA